jgi:L-arabinose isomerase
MKTGCAAWILAGGAHHTVFSQNLSTEQLLDFAEIAGIESVLINKETTIHSLKKELRLNEVYYR